MTGGSRCGRWRAARNVRSVATLDWQILRVRQRVQAQEVVAYAHLARFKGDVLQAGGVPPARREILLDDAALFSVPVMSASDEAAYPDKAAVVDYALGTVSRLRGNVSPSPGPASPLE